MKVREKFLYEIWKEKKFIKSLSTADSQSIEIIDPGLQNKELAGPDFHNARIRIGNITYLGDVEIDTSHSNWKTHGHYIDNKYNKVILHVVLSNEKNKNYVFTKEGRKVQSICLVDFLDENFQNSLRNAIRNERNDRTFSMPCSESNSLVTEKEKLDILFDLGTMRFKNKTKKIFDRLKEMVYLKKMNIREPIVRYDFGDDFFNKKFSPNDFDDEVIWQQLVYEMIFEALGYSKNKDIMLKLAKAVNIEFLKNYSNKENFDKIIECSLFNVSGLIPSEFSFNDEATSEYVRGLVETWDRVKENYDGPTFSPESWHFFKLRPQNFPTVRISGGSRLLQRIIEDELIKKFINLTHSESKTKKVTNYLRNIIIVKGGDYWKNHFTFDKIAKEEVKYFIGLSRADEIIVNVILPVLSLYFEIFSEPDAARSIKNLYINYTQKSSNQLVNKVCETLNLTEMRKKSVYYQGMIELFRSYCVKEKCLECKIGEKVFN
ncbi:MAG: hypothetical protein DRQ01_02220 [Ignavibacteriae bacterium]|nr:MAG: hypothetical protein DRQ01_02220 [Ignavibacteriota bacterium]